MSSESKDRLALRMQPETRRKIEQWYAADDCRSMNEFVEKAVNFYADYLAVNDSNGLLPKSITSAIDGRLSLFENRMAKLLYKQAVELDMGMSTIADCVNLDEEYLRRRRAKSVSNVKQTNGQLRFEEIARAASEERLRQQDPFDDEEDDDEWLD